MSGGALVIGGDTPGVQAALDLADRGINITLVEPSPSLRTGGGTEALRLMPTLLKARRHPNIHILTSSNVVKVRGTKGNFRVTVTQQPRYVKDDICVSCARCERECPVTVIPPPGETFDGHKAIHRPAGGLKSVPSAYVVDKKGIAPCTAACPAGVNIQGYVALIAQGKFAAALKLITESVAFPRVLGRVCTHPCETACTREKIDHPVAICALKRFVSNGSSSLTTTEVIPPSGPLRVAIIGSGPAGLSAARDLAHLGHRVTVFEALPAPGGMITVGMPRFRLPREVRQADIDDILRIGGIEIKTATPIGPNLTLDELKHQGYEAILIAVGAHKNQRLGIPGEGLTGVIDSIALLQSLNLKQPITIGRKVVIIGGGYTGIDSARTAVRLHCERVLVMDRCAREDLPANPEEIIEAAEEGVEFEYLVSPVRITGEDNKVVGIQCRRMKSGERDKTGRRHTTPIEGSEFLVPTDTVIVAAGQRPDLSFLGVDAASLTEGKRHIVVDPVTMATPVPGIFAAGDAAADPGPIINAIATGCRAAVSIDRLLRGQSLTEGRSPHKVTPVEVDLATVTAPLIERQPMPCLKYEDRIGNFEEVDLGFSAEMAVREAKRCLNCAVCSQCRECERACELNAINHDMTAQQTELEVGAIVVSGHPDTALNRQVWDTEELNSVMGYAGIYLIPSSPDMETASAVAGQVIVDLAPVHQSRQEREPVITTTPERKAPASDIQPARPTSKPRVGIFVCDCGGSISEVIDVPDVVEHCHRLKGTVLSRRVGYACTEESAREIKTLARQHNLTHVILAACTCCNTDQICFSCSDRRVQCKSNLLDPQEGTHYEFVNIREHCAWVHRQQAELATAKAKSLVSAGLARARESQPQIRRTVSISPGVLVVGNGLSGMQAASDLSAQGFSTVLVGGYVPDKESPEFHSVRQNLEKELAGNRTMILNSIDSVSVDGQVGQYQATVARNWSSHRFTVGAIILDLSNGLNGRRDRGLTEEMKLPPLLLKAIHDGDSRPQVTTAEPVESRLPGIFLCGNRKTAPSVTEALIQGSAAAGKAAILLNKSILEVIATTASVNPQRCRGCGTCESVCQAGAITVMERIPGISSARVDEGLCQGCGICVASCPSGALSQSGCSDRQVTASLEAILSRI